VHNKTQNIFDNLPSYLQTNIIAQMLSWGCTQSHITRLHGSARVF